MECMVSSKQGTTRDPKDVGSTGRCFSAPGCVSYKECFETLSYTVMRRHETHIRE